MRIVAAIIGLCAFAEAGAQIAFGAFDQNFQVINETNDLTVTKPAGVVDDDVMVARCALDNSNNDATDPMLDAPVGWVKQVALSTTITVARGRAGAVWVKVASGEGASYDFGHNNPSATELHCAIESWTGVDTTTPVDVTPIAGHLDTTTDTTAPQSPSITTVTDNARVTSWCWTTGNTGTAYDSPGNGTERYDLDQDHTGMALADIATTTAGLVTPQTFTHTNGGATDDSYCTTLALRPALSSSIAPLAYEYYSND